MILYDELEKEMAVAYLLRRTEKNHELLSQNRWPPGKYSELEHEM
jgi:hypothetical protein